MTLLLSPHDAKNHLLEHLNPDPYMQQVGDEWVVVDKDTITKSYGWVFRVASRNYMTTRDRKHRVTGIGGYVVEKTDGSIHSLGTIYSLKTWLKIYEFQRSPSLIRNFIQLMYQLFDDWISKGEGGHYDPLD